MKESIKVITTILFGLVIFVMLLVTILFSDKIITLRTYLILQAVCFTYMLLYVFIGRDK